MGEVEPVASAVEVAAEYSVETLLLTSSLRFRCDNDYLVCAR